MSDFRHPSELNQMQRFLQARSILRNTSRAFNDAWYHDALALETQLHMRVDGGEIKSWLYHSSSNKWEAGPEVSEDVFTDPDTVQAFIDDLFGSVIDRNTPSLGIILHIADEFATTELDPSHDDPSKLAALRQTVATDPGSVIADSSLHADQHSCRLLPYSSQSALSIATAVTLSRRCDGFLRRCRMTGEERNFPIRTLALSAPLVLLQALPFLYEDDLGHPIIAVFHYPAFTLLSFLDADGNLVLLRTLHHRGQAIPTNLRHAASTTAAALEFANSRVLVVPLASHPATELVANLEQVFSDIRLLDWSQTPYSPEATGVAAVEAPASLADTSAAGTPLSNALTFSILRDEAWVRQDFFSPEPEVVERFPDRTEMRLLRMSRFAHLGFAAVGLILIAWLVLTIIGTIRRPEWAFNPGESTALKQRLAGLDIEQARISHWENLLEDRSKAWVNMEMLCRLFPKDSGILLRAAYHTVKPDPTRGQAKIGFVKEWRISGHAREDAVELLTKLNTQEGISAAFSQVAEATANQSFEADLPSRTLVANLRTAENAGFKPRPIEDIVDSDESTYPFTFDLTITQRFESSDPMALLVAKAPNL